MPDRPNNIPEWLLSIRKFYSEVLKDYYSCNRTLSLYRNKNVEEFKPKILNLEPKIISLIDIDGEKRKAELSNIKKILFDIGVKIYNTVAFSLYLYILKKVNVLNRWYNKRIYPGTIKRDLSNRLEEIDNLIVQIKDAINYSEKKEIYLEIIKIGKKAIDDFESGKLEGQELSIKRTYIIWAAIVTAIFSIMSGVMTWLITQLLTPKCPI